MVGLVLELLLQPRQRAQGLFELAVLERDGSVAGERLKQLEVVAVEGAQVAQPVGNHDGTDQPRLADERRIDGVPEPTSARLVARDVQLRDEERPPTRDALDESRIVERGAHRLHHRDRLARPDAGSQDLLALLHRQQ